MEQLGYLRLSQVFIFPQITDSGVHGRSPLWWEDTLNFEDVLHFSGNFAKMEFEVIFVDLYKQILIEALSNEKVQVTFPNLSIDAKEIVEGVCYQALKKIKTILDDPSLEDEDCFQKIEEIVCTFEEIGSGGGIRHDYG